MRRSVDWAFAGLASNGPWEELFYPGDAVREDADAGRAQGLHP